MKNNRKEEQKLQEIFIGTKSDEIVNAFNESALKNWPLPTNKGD